ncbi:MAG: hypothetical protein J6B45_02655 [Clostridia bacterium]|nr:hypothetical protein [Clostridia bacterium]
MNRGPFLHGMMRYANAQNEKNRRYKKISKGRTILNLVAFLLGLTILIVVFSLGAGAAFLAGAVFFFAICAIPFTMSVGRRFVMGELEIAINQRRAEMKLEFNVKRVMLGYVFMFAPLYIIMLGCFFFPAHDAWIVPYIPVFVYTLVAAIVSKHTVEAFDFSVKKYKWIHISLYIGILIAGVFVRIFIMYPFLDN